MEIGNKYHDKGKSPVVLRWLLIVLLVRIVPAVPAFAQVTDDTIANIRVDGAQRVDSQTIISYLTVKSGDSFDSAALDASLKSIFRTGLFADATLGREGRTLVVRVKENPVINKVAFEGNSALTTEALEAEIQLRSRTVFTRPKAQGDVQRILELYRRSGRFAARVEPRVVELSQNRVDLVFEIQEGERTKVQRITFNGNKSFSGDTLRSAIATRESAWWRFLSSSDTYDPDRLAYDEELLRQHYLANGYADFRVVSSVAKLSQDKSEFYLDFTLHEGDKYKISDVQFTTTLKNLDPETFRPISLVYPGDTFSNKRVEKTVQKIIDALGNKGYAFVQIDPDFRKDAVAKTIAVTFAIQEGPKVYIDRINVSGNVRTLDSVIRREFRLAEGDPYNSDKLKESERRLKNIDYFEKVEIKNAPGSAPDRTDINVRVEEKSTGEISLGAGFSSTESILGDIRLRERNFLGRGQDAAVAATVSSRRKEYTASFTEPYFLGRYMSAGVDVFRQTNDLQRESSYDEQRTGGGVRLGYDLTEDLRQTLRYTVRNVKIDNVSSDASNFIKQQEGTALTSAVGQDLLYDRRDNRNEPSQGYYLRQGNEVAGVGGDVNYIRTTVGGGVFFPLAEEDWVLGLETEGGYTFGYGGENVRIPDRFFVGGANLRGFKPAGIGPRDKATGDALGGTKYVTGTTEMRFPLGFSEDLGILGRAFVDAGALTDPDTAGKGIQDNNSLRLASGVGITWRSPFGPVRVDFSQAVLKESYDKTEFFRFNFGTRF